MDKSGWRMRSHHFLQTESWFPGPIMIFDKIENASQYFHLSDRFAKAFEYLQSVDGSAMLPGKYEISGDALYALVQSYSTGEKKDRLEAHRRYADIHFMVMGVESVGIADINDLEAGAYDDKTDYVPMTGRADFFHLPEGSFMILFPQDAHMPGVAVENPQMIKKIVIKVLLD